MGFIVTLGVFGDLRNTPGAPQKSQKSQKKCPKIERPILKHPAKAKVPEVRRLMAGIARPRLSLRPRHMAITFHNLDHYCGAIHNDLLRAAELSAPSGTQGYAEKDGIDRI
jgi:hypothetical protein